MFISRFHIGFYSWGGTVGENFHQEMCDMQNHTSQGVWAVACLLASLRLLPVKEWPMS